MSPTKFLSNEKLDPQPGQHLVGWFRKAEIEIVNRWTEGGEPFVSWKFAHSSDHSKEIIHTSPASFILRNITSRTRG